MVRVRYDKWVCIGGRFAGRYVINFEGDAIDSFVQYGKRVECFGIDQILNYFATSHFDIINDFTSYLY